MIIAGGRSGRESGRLWNLSYACGSFWSLWWLSYRLASWSNWGLWLELQGPLLLELQGLSRLELQEPLLAEPPEPQGLQVLPVLRVLQSPQARLEPMEQLVLLEPVQQEALLPAPEPIRRPEKAWREAPVGLRVLVYDSWVSSLRARPGCVGCANTAVRYPDIGGNAEYPFRAH